MRSRVESTAVKIHDFLPVIALILLAAVAANGQVPVRIENQLYIISANPADASFSVVAKGSGRNILTAGRLGAAGGTYKVVRVPHTTFGDGDGIEVDHPDGNRQTVALHPGLPFVLFSGTLHNGTASDVVLNRVPTVSAQVDLGKPLAAIRTLGTGGLLPAEKNPGSYAFLAVVDPESRSGVVGGWLTHDRGSGVVFSPVQQDAVRIQAQLEYGRLRIKPGQDAAMETFAIGHFDDARLGLEAYADAVARVYSIKLPPPRAGYCTWYMEKHGGACDEKNVAELSAYAAKHLKPFGFDFIQIDDGWQEGIKTNGPKKNFTAHAPQGAYPSGMKAAADAIKSLELTPGIWFMPFAGNYKDPFFAAHQDWFARKPDGTPYETAWGGTCLDMTHPGAQEFVRSVVHRLAGDWGYRVFKMDGFWTGSATKQIYVNDGYKDDGIGDATFFNPDKTNIEALRDGVRLVRQAAGPEVFLLGCCVSQNMRSFGGSFGLLDAMRVGPDTGAGRIGAPHASRLWFLNGRVWWNDPDCVSVRAATPLEQARLNASFTAIAGALFYNSDWMPDLPAERLEILRRTVLPHTLQARPVDVFESEPARIWHMADNRSSQRRDMVALYNWERAPAAVECDVARIGLPPAAEYVAFDFWGNRFVAPFRDKVRADLPSGGSCRILAVRPAADHPQLISTSRHITQGMVDVTGEAWDAATARLSATSRVVADDPYELRIILPTGEKSWRATAVSVSAEDVAAGVKATFKQDGPKLRATIASPISREVRWHVQFEPARVNVAAPQAVMNLKAMAEYQRVILSWDESGAEGYRITRSDGVAFDCAATSFIDAGVVHGRTYQYRIAAVGWDRRPGREAMVDVTTPAELKRPATPPVPAIHVADLKSTILKNGWGKPGINLSVQGKPLSIEGKRYEKGLGLHANAAVRCPIPANARRFVAVVGLDDAMRRDERPSVVFEVYGDVKEMGEEPVLLAQSPVISPTTIRAWCFDVELNTRYKELRLVVTDAGDGIAADHADWVDAGFVTAEEQR